MTSSGPIIKQAIMIYLDSGMTDKSEIYSAVVEKLGVARPMVRRCARELRETLEYKVKILQDLNSSGKPKTESKFNRETSIYEKFVKFNARYNKTNNEWAIGPEKTGIRSDRTSKIQTRINPIRDRTKKTVNTSSS